jgi:hypothetical protein
MGLPDSTPGSDTAWTRCASQWSTALSPDELDELASATGLYKRGALSPFGTPTKTRHTSERIAPESDPGFREIKALKERLARKDDAG